MKKCGKKAIFTKENISKEVDFIKDESSKDYNWESCGKSFSEALSFASNKKMTSNGRAVLRIHIFKVPYLLPIKGRGD